MELFRLSPQRILDFRLGIWVDGAVSQLYAGTFRLMISGKRPNLVPIWALLDVAPNRPVRELNAGSDERSSSDRFARQVS